MIKSREDVKTNLKWDLSAIVSNDDEWNTLFEELEKEADKCLTFKGKLSDEKFLLECLILNSNQSRQLSKLYVYAKMKSDEDTSNSLYKGMVDKAEMLVVKLNSNTSFIVPEITQMDKETILSFVEKPGFEDFSVMFEEIARNKEHILSEAEEKILAETGIFSSNFQDIFNVLNNADLKFGKIKDENGKEIELSHGTYSMMLQSSDRRVREDAFKVYYQSFIDMINTLASNYGGNIKKNCFYAKVRKYNSALEKSMNNENVSKKVYENLIKYVDENLNSVHKYVNIRKKVMGLDKIHMYDLYNPIIEGAELKMEYDDAYKLVIDALKPLGEDYVAKLKEAYENRWIDVYETKNKRSGAYSWGTYDAHPYVLLNYKKTTHDIFTIAHEMGHAMHSYKSNHAQPYEKAGYEIFVAEVASTVNEMLLLNYLLKTEDKELKKYLLTYLIDTFRTTLFRQTMFAEFEKDAHEMFEKGVPLTADNLNDLYYNLNVKYYGEEVSDDEIKYEWSRIPHFYSAFYVYKYATGIISASTICENILSRGEEYVEKYFKFLSAGGSLPPVDILRLAEVDLETKVPYEKAMKLFNETVEEIDKLL